MSPAISVRQLRVTYGRTVAVDGLDLQVPRGQVVGLVGPNGAGKTTTMECIEGLRRADSGRVLVLGLDPVRDRRRLFRRVGVQLQEAGVYPNIRVGEAMRLFASFFERPLDPAALLEELGLAECAGAAYRVLSGGQKRRLLLALALVGAPEVLVLDEPTTGLDPEARLAFWSAVRRLRAGEGSVLVTTHDLWEAEKHCDRVIVVEHGRVVMEGPPRELLSRHGLGVRMVLGDAGSLPRQALAVVAGLRPVEHEGSLVVYGRDHGQQEQVLEALRDSGHAPALLEVRTANLEDLYLIATGRRYRGTGG